MENGHIIRRRILEKLLRRLPEQEGNEIGEHPTKRWSMEPDVIVNMREQTILFEPQNLQASSWLREHCNLATENITGNTEFFVHPLRGESIVTELKKAGFIVGDYSTRHFDEHDC
jgi:hypothetical protein